ncbi:choice-of-anchor X domain-containing protein [Trichlorobacter ammonificans]|uniref:Uncharacterized protein n=1 Tax=Trichlorobacter ammonificans TaxID=2916410 RepID=A0ABM9DCQ6_9BACT|nr:choice-of-anchor X domain-containing protein [Trichlorobacter ammonificans]CAH2032114.1 conserved exported protein of unknown function [Trichlorobacter ammonificans]
MYNRLPVRLTALWCIVLLVCSSVLPAAAALHPLSMLQHNQSTGIGDIDITISLDWNPDTVNTSVTPRGMTRAETEAAVRSYAASLHAMTNGLHRLRNVYVYTNRKSWANADIRYIGTKAGRSEANIAGWQTPNQQITMYVYEDDSQVDEYPGPVLAHESGHYVYGLLDEYREQGAQAQTISQLIAAGLSYMPSGEDDGSQPSIMNQHASYPNWFSTAEGYAGPAVRLNTAHYRVYGKSIWDTLTSAPTSDPEYAQGFGRQQFEAFAGKRVRSAGDLKAGQTGTLNGYDAALNIVWVDAPILNLVLLDANIPAARWPEALNAVATLTEHTPSQSYLEVLSGGDIAVPRTLVTDGTRTSLATQARGVTQGKAVALQDALVRAVEETKKYRATLKNPQVSVIHLLTASNQPVSASLLTTLRANNIMLKILYSDTPEARTAAKATQRPAPRALKASDPSSAADGQVYLSQLSQATGGSFTTANSPAELENRAALATQELEGYAPAIINESVMAALAANQSYSMQFTVGRHDPVPLIIMSASKADFARLSPSLTDPKGQKVTGSTAGITLVEDSENGGWLWLIDPDTYTGSLGVWTARLTASAAVSNEVGMLAASISELQMQLDVIQRPVLGNLLEVSLRLGRPILHARVRVTVYNESGTPLRSGVLLSDDGKHGDLRPNDGIYTLSLNDLKPGEYSFAVVVDDNGGTAIVSDRGTMFNPKKSARADEYTGPFQRIDEATFAVAALPASPGDGGGGGGGCAVGSGTSGDLLLAMTVIVPVLYLLLPRRRRH